MPLDMMLARDDVVVDPRVQAIQLDQALQYISKGVAPGTPFEEYRSFFLNLCAPQSMRKAPEEKIRSGLAGSIDLANAVAREFRSNIPGYLQKGRFPAVEDLVQKGAISKSTLDVGTLTNFANITGGQALGYVSLDTQLARGTVRPSSFTLYQALKKSAAYQVVDFWAYIDDTGGALPGAAFSGFSNVQSGTLATNAGIYTLQSVLLRLMLDGRAMTVALASQNSFVDIVTQENANAALTVLSTANWACYHGNNAIFPNQFNGLSVTVPSGNAFNFQTFLQNPAVTANGWSNSQALYNLIYQASADITSWFTFGRITHAFMSPVALGSLQPLITTVLNNIVNNITPEVARAPGIVVDGDLQGMRTRMGTIQFAQDLFITARDMPAQAMVRQNGTTPATTTAPTPPATVTIALSGAASPGSMWTAAYTSGGAGANYVWAVASCDTNMNESTLTYSSVTLVSGMTASGAATLTIAPPGAADAAAFRVYRSGLGYAKTSHTPYSFRYIGVVAASGSSNVTFVDNNTRIPGSETIYLLDLAEEDNAIDWRFLLPISKIELFAQNIFMPWAVAMIGALRVRIPKFSGIITDYVPDNPEFNPLGPNN